MKTGTFCLVKDQDTKKVSNRIFNGKALPGRVGGGFYTFVARDGQARWTSVQIGHQAEAFWVDRSFYVARVGRL